jgi:hypothetical protein
MSCERSTDGREMSQPSRSTPIGARGTSLLALLHGGSAVGHKSPRSHPPRWTRLLVIFRDAHSKLRFCDEVPKVPEIHNAPCLLGMSPNI